MSKGFIINKNNKNKEIEILEYEMDNGFNVSPKNKVKKGNSINVTKVIFMSPTLIEKILNKKIDKQYNKIINLVTTIISDDEGNNSDDSSFMIGVLNEIELFKSIVKNKYSKFMKEEQTEKLLKRLSIMSKELRKRILEIEEEKVNEMNVSRRR